MRIRHLVAAGALTPDDEIGDPSDIRHGVIVGGRVAALAGPVDPATHLNRDFPAHRCCFCVAVEELTVGAPVLRTENGFLLAAVPPTAFAHHGRVDLARRRAAWRAAVTPGRP